MVATSRRQLLGAMVVGAGVTALPRLGLGTPYAEDAGGRFTAGTTIEATVARQSGLGYARVLQGPGERGVVREDLAAGRSGREDRRVGVGTIAQLTDLHVTDAQHPLRFEYLDRVQTTGHRPQELLGVHGVISLVRRINGLAGGPFTQRPVDVTVTTGDNTDNQSGRELDWVLTALAGGWVRPDSGAAGAFEGVATSGLIDYWQPDSEVPDRYKQAGFPAVPGLVSAATAPIWSPGLATPWLLTMGNHDVVAGGMLGDRPYVDEWAAGDRKIFAASCPQAGTLEDLLARVAPGDDIGGLLDAIAATADTRTVTPDEGRIRVTPERYVHRVRDPRYTGAGPQGHGLAADATPDRLYFSHPVGDEVLVISLDSTNQAGGINGSLGSAQLAWLDRELAAYAGRYVVVLSHHPSDAMDNLAPDPRAPYEQRHDGAEVTALLHRHPNVVAWLNGHTHHNAITPHPHPDPRRSFWEINTASHVDAPQQARLIEVADNRDGTISLFTTMLDSDAPAAAPYDDLTPVGLAALYRELAFNDPAWIDRGGGRRDRNTELLLADPL